MITFFCFCFLGLYLWHMEVPRLGAQLELQLPVCTTATAARDPRCICSLHHSSCQGRILKPLSKAREWTHILVDTSQVCYHQATAGTPRIPFNDWVLDHVSQKQSLKWGYLFWWLLGPLRRQEEQRKNRVSELEVTKGMSLPESAPPSLL